MHLPIAIQIKSVEQVIDGRTSTCTKTQCWQRDPEFPATNVAVGIFVACAEDVNYARVVTREGPTNFTQSGVTKRGLYVARCPPERDRIAS